MEGFEPGPEATPIRDRTAARDLALGLIAKYGSVQFETKSGQLTGTVAGLEMYTMQTGADQESIKQSIVDKITDYLMYANEGDILRQYTVN